MQTVLELLKAVLFGIVEGITEWLPISSTGHLILLENFVSLQISAEFWEMFEVVIQLGAILAVVVLYWNTLWPFGRHKRTSQKKNTWKLWSKIVVAVLPSAVIGFLLDDWFDEHFYNYLTVAVALIVYGILFLVIEHFRAGKSARVESLEKITYRDALTVGAFQVLALIPGTSRSGSTILGAMLFGLSRPVAAEFSFFLAIPTMAGASLLKAAKYFLGGSMPSINEWLILLVGCVTAFLVSYAAIRFLTDFVRRHTFSAFGIYRIVLGAIVLLWFLITL